MISASVLALALATGCAIDKGTALAADFEEDWSGTPDVVKIHTTKSNTLPFLGMATGTLTVRDGAPAARVSALTGELRKYVSDHDTVTGRITAGAITFTVVGDQRRTGDVLALWGSLSADDRVVDCDIDDATTKETGRWRVKVTADGAAGTLAVFKDLTTDGDRHRPPSSVTSLEISTGPGARPGLSVETGFDGGLPAEAIAAYEAVSAQYSVVYATLKTDRVSIGLADGEDAAQARELAQEAAPKLGPAVHITTE